MRKRIIGLLTAVVIASTLLYGCGSSKDAMESKSEESGINKAANEYVTSETIAATAAQVQKGAGSRTAEADDRGAVNADQQVSIAFSEAVSDVGSAPNPVLDQRKVIRSANVTVEVDSFDEAYGKINSAILGIGFIQETNINTDRVYVDRVQKLVKHGTIVIRVDRNKFDKVLNGLKEIGAVLNWSIQGEDVTEKYFDTESRLKLLRLEEERVLEYLKKLDNPDKIVTYETRLTNIRHEIESLTGTLRKLSDLVDLSTITITMNEKYPGSDKPVIEKTYWDRLGEKFKQSMKGVIDFCGDFIIFIISALPVLLLLGLFGWFLFAIYRKIYRAIRKDKARYGSCDSGYKNDIARSNDNENKNNGNSENG